MKNNVILSFIFLELLVVNNIEQNSNPSQSYKRMQQSIQATQTGMPINNFIDVRENVNTAREKYKRAREAQQKQAELLDKMSK